MSTHPPSSDVDVPSLVPTLSSLTATVQPPASTAHDIEDSMDLSTSENCVDSSGVSSASTTAAMFLLTFKERYSLPQTAIDFAVGTINGIISSVCGSMSSSGEFEDPFALLRTEYKQNKFYRDVFGLVVSLVV